MYQAREGAEETALEKFVNELLGLEKLDSLRNGLSDAHDLRLLKKLAIGVDEADREAKATAAQLKKESALRTEIRTEIANARAGALDAITELHPDATADMTDSNLLQFIESALDRDTTDSESSAAAILHQEVIALSGRISALAERPTTQRIQELHTVLATAIAQHKAWVDTDGARVREWETAAQAAGADLRNEPRYAVEQTMGLTTQELDNASNIHAQAESLSVEIESSRLELDLIQTKLAAAHEHSSALVESLSALRTIIGTSDRCPVCDRDFAETGHHSLLAHIDTKLSELTTHGQQLVDLRNVRDQLAAQIARTEVEYSQLTTRLLPDDQQQALIQRHATLVDLTAHIGEIEAARSHGAVLTRNVRDLQQSLENLEAASSEQRYISREVAKYAARLHIRVPQASEPFQTISTELLEHAEAQVTQLTHKAHQYRKTRQEAARLTAALERESVVIQSIADTAEHKKQWDDRVIEAKRRQKVAKEVHEAATQARTTIVHRVFTESLNEVWKAVFTRLAPNERFIPSFGIPNATKKTFDIKLETTHRTGEASGPPQMMLSAGNLNTAALSLFLALHLAVEPIVPCLVFDDPVQAIDEVHIAQFAALIRLLSKQNDRQVIIAVHERELFEYLALELSPAYEGDELITIELGERATEQDQGITRHHWTPDPALAN